MRLSLARRFQIASLLVLLVSGIALAVWVGREIEEGVLHRAAAIAALYVDSIVSPNVQVLAQRGWLQADETTALDGVLRASQMGTRIVALKVWAPDGTVVYSPDTRIIGMQFPVQGGLARALTGEVPAELSSLEDSENLFERGTWARLLEVYVPVREDSDGRIIAVTEFYQVSDDLENDVAEARWRSWGVVAAVTLATYLLLIGIVRRGSDTIDSQQRTLRQRVLDLSALLRQNAQLHERVRGAAERTTTLNEQALRRISADLHDGPCQALAFGLLRLDSVAARVDGTGEMSAEFHAVQTAVRDALEEIRSISAGLRLPQLAELSLSDVALRAVDEHRKLTGRVVQLNLGQVPRDAPLALKIAVFRLTQEALSNGSKHATNSSMSVDLLQESDELLLSVSDTGPGFDPAAAESGGRLGLSGMRERAELLGGTFEIASLPEQGTTIRARWPMAEVFRLRLTESV